MRMHNDQKFTDSQRSKLYAAEQGAFGLRPAMAQAEVGQLVKEVMRCCESHSNPHLRSLTKAPTIRFSQRKRSGAYYRELDHLIVFGRRSIKDWIVIHEMTHAAVRAGAVHGPEFALGYLDLIEGILGFDARQTLRGQFAKHKVRSWGKSKPRKPVPVHQTKLAKVQAWAAARGYRVHEGWTRWYDVELQQPEGRGIHIGCVYGLAEVIDVINMDIAYREEED